MAGRYRGGAAQLVGEEAGAAGQGLRTRFGRRSTGAANGTFART
jgi:hypothetical protein